MLSDADGRKPRNPAKPGAGFGVQGPSIGLTEPGGRGNPKRGGSSPRGEDIPGLTERSEVIPTGRTSPMGAYPPGLTKPGGRGPSFGLTEAEGRRNPGNDFGSGIVYREAPFVHVPEPVSFVRFAPPEFSFLTPIDLSRMNVRRLLTVLLLLSASTAHAQTFTNESSRLRSLPDPNQVIGDVAVADFNADGRLDFYHAGRLYRQAQDGSFENVLEQANILLEGNAVRGGIFGDANRDGLLDLLIMDGGPGSRFYLNRGGEKFDLGNGVTNLIFQNPPVGAFWADVNADSFVDFVVGSRNGTNPVFLGGASGTFTNSGPVIQANTEPVLCGMAMADFDHDNDPDFYASRCGAGNELRIYNAGQDRYTTAFRGSGVESDQNSQDAYWFDHDNDGWEDLLVVNFNAEFKFGYNQFYRFDGTTFTDISEQSGLRSLATPDNGPAAIADFDNDGWLDVYLPVNNQGRLFHNRGDGTFEDIWDQSVRLDSVSGAVATGDFNNDGWMDLLIPDQYGTAIMINDGGENNWATFQLRTTGNNKLGVGARIHLFSGGIEQVRTVTAGTGAGSQSDGLRAHFGVGTADLIDEVRIHWPDGQTESYLNVPVNEHHTVVEGVGLNAPPAAFALSSPINAAYVDPSEETIRFEWEASSDAEDDVEYTLVLTGKALRLSFSGLDETSIEVATDILPANQVYFWSVLASDGYSLRGSSRELSFSFGQPDVANSTLAEPVLYEFGLPRVSSGVAEFSDFDLDGDLDLLVGGDANGTAVLRIYRADDDTVVLGNEGGEYIFKSMMQTGINLEAVSNPRASWGDLDGNGFPDLLISGISQQSGEPLTTIYNNQVGQFIPLAINVLPNVWGGIAEWADLNGDGNMDLIITGSTTIAPPYAVSASVFMNDGNGGLSEVDANMPPIMFGDAAFADIDGDGDLDMALTGDLGNGRFHSGIYENTGIGSGGQFQFRPAPLPDVMGGSVAWGDVDADGDPDLLVSGGTLDPHMQRGVTQLFVNNGGFFTLHPFPFDGVVTGRAIWGDYENDGDQDVFVVGARSPLGETVGRLYRNENGQFVAELDVKGFVHATAAFGDYNGDGDLDLIAFGIDADGNLATTFYINQQVPEPVPVTR